MTLNEVLNYVDILRPGNPYPKSVKTMWVSECEGLVQTQVFCIAPEEIITYKYLDSVSDANVQDANGIDLDDRNKTLLVYPPHDKIYAEYVCAKIDEANGEYDKYQNTSQVFNNYFGEFERWFAENYLDRRE